MDENNVLEVFLPSVSELESMNSDEFADWIYQAKRELPKRAEKRDPLLHLKKRISILLSKKDMTEEQLEARILSEIERYERIISRPQR
mgnify:CR=1 FL=1